MAYEREGSKSMHMTNASTPRIHVNDNWSKVVDGINKKYGQAIMRYEGNDNAGVLTDALINNLRPQLWVDWLEKYCTKSSCKKSFKILLNIIGGPSDAQGQAMNYAPAQAIWGPAYPQCDCFKDKIAFSRAIVRGDESYVGYQKGLAQSIVKNPTDWEQFRDKRMDESDIKNLMGF